MTQIKGLIHSTESFGSVDGPGVRFIIFVQGCPLRCQFCHNPDTWNMTDKNGATWRSADELLAQALRYRTYWKNGGGITVSGGEPGGPFTREEPFFSKFQELMQYTDLLLVDIKHIDEKSHKELTGKTNKNILDMIRFLSDIKKPVWIRHVLVPERSDYDEYLNRLNDFIQTLDNVERVEILPYHTLGAYKWKELGLDYPLEGINPPSRERVENAKKILHCS